MEVICEIGICSREKNARARDKRENFPEKSESNVEQKEKEVERDVARVIKILLQENVDILQDKIADALSFYRLLFGALVFISHFIIINFKASLFNPFAVILLPSCVKTKNSQARTLKEFASREDTRGREDAIYLIYWSINIPNLYQRHNSFVHLPPAFCLSLSPSLAVMIRVAASLIPYL